MKIKAQQNRVRDFFKAVRRKLETIPIGATPGMGGAGYGDSEKAKNRMVETAAQQLQAWLIVTGGRKAAMNDTSQWQTFYFEGNHAWGFVRSRADWDNNVLRPYAQVGSVSPDELRLAVRQKGDREDPYGPSCPVFGFDLGVYEFPRVTLGEFADQHSMKLD